MYLLDKFRNLWKYYILQSMLATLALMLIVLAMKHHEKIVVIASLGATAFICFAMPKSISARTKHVVGGHLVGIICGAIFSVITLPHYISYSAAVGLAIFVMVVIDVEHPPAAGTALAMTVHDITLAGAGIIILAAALMALVRYLLRDYIKELT